MLKVGLTGNIGSGKTTVAKIFSILGTAVFNADEEAKKLLNEPSQQSGLVNYFGNDILGSDHRIDRTKLANHIFNNKGALSFINQLIHPLVRQNFSEFCHLHSNYPVCIYEAAVIIETGFYKQLDKIILVTAPEEVRIQRVVLRDHTSAELLEPRMKNQWPEELKIPHADYVINNDGLTPLLEQCQAIFAEIS
ncbi:MAG: dephospho-CoA kinase [Bacteroidales bacterium]|nr:dephospho-CoA kinase [Bacteroidales bacterium]